MPYIHVQPDSKYGLELCSSRFELPAGAENSPVFPAMLEREAKRIARLTVQQNAKRGWHWRSDLGTHVDVSELQLAVRDFNPSKGALDVGTDYNANTKAYVVKMWFEAKQIVTEDIIYDDEDEARLDGFVKDLQDFEDEV